MSSEPSPLPFAHLHQHTSYSLLDGAARIKDLINWVREISPARPVVAITDHGNMHGAIEFYKMAEQAAVKPIIGLEAYVTAGSRFEKRKANSKLDGGYFHLTLLAKNMIGYKNLCKLNSRAWLEGFYGKPRVDHELLREYSQGVIALSGCLGAQLPRTLLDASFEAGEEVLQQYLSIYGDDLFIEVQNHGLAEQQRLNPMLKELARRYGLGLVATNDGHYVKRSDARAHEALLALQTKTTLSDPNRFRFACDEFYVKTPAEMADAVPEADYPGALANSMLVADLCDLLLPIGDNRVYQIPEIALPPGRTLGEQLRFKTYEGLLARYDAITEALLRRYLSLAQTDVPEQHHDLLLALAKVGERCQQEAKERKEKYVRYPHLDALKASGVDPAALTMLERAEYELGVIIAMKFPDYFLIVADFINWAKGHGIAVGPGRGSGAGSIVAYATRITDIDPLAFNLLFERFLNPDRVSMPDFDVDFSDARRMEVVDYVRRQYGEERVAQIATFGTMASKAAIKDAARVLEAPYAEADKVSKLIPMVFGRSIPIAKALQEVPEIKQAYDQGAREFIDVALALEGLTRHASVHAAGVIIAREPVQELAPVFRSGDGPIVCQYDMNSVEELGFLKMDFLGLRTLTFIETAVRIIKQTRGLSLNPDKFLTDDEKTFELLSRGDAAGVFQFESAGMVDTLKKLKPRRIQDLIAVAALYRPGPMENIPTYIRRHHGLEQVDYSAFPRAEPLLRPILEETYGIPVYQEQIMQIAQAVAGYTLGEADLLRRAMGKKKLDEMLKQRVVFEKGAAGNGIGAEEANHIFDLLEKFANYGFNKSHSAAYGMLSYQTAYLKAHYPVEFMAALLTVERGDSDKVAQYVADARHLGIQVLPPDINESGADFTPVGEVIRFGLAGVKNVGDGAVAQILAERQRGGRFRDLADFCRRTHGNVNKRAVEHLIKAGACDELGERHRLLANLETLLKWGAAQFEQAASGQFGLFALDAAPPLLAEAPPLSRLELLRLEKDALGLYISDHPLNSYPGLAAVAHCPIAQVTAWCKALLRETGEQRCKVVLSGLVQAVVKKPTKKGGMMARFELADESGACELMVFNRVYEEIAEQLTEDLPAVVVVDASEDGESLRLAVDRFIRWEERHTLPQIAVVAFNLATVDEQLLLDFRSRLDELSGITPLHLQVRTTQGVVTYATEARVESERLLELEASYPWLRAALTIDRMNLLRSRNGRSLTLAPEVPF